MPEGTKKSPFRKLVRSSTCELNPKRSQQIGSHIRVRTPRFHVPCVLRVAPPSLVRCAFCTCSRNQPRPREFSFAECTATSYTRVLSPDTALHINVCHSTIRLPSLRDLLHFDCELSFYAPHRRPRDPLCATSRPVISLPPYFPPNACQTRTPKIPPTAD